MKRFMLVFFALLLIGAGAVQWAVAAWDALGPKAQQGSETVVMIVPGTPLHAIAGKLADARTLNYPFLFEANLRLRGLMGSTGAPALKAGEYAIPSQASMSAIAAILSSGKSIQHKLTIAEGLTSDMIHKLVVNDPVLTGDAGPVPDEGTLLPETYLFTRGMTRQAMLRHMAQEQKAFLAEKWPGRDAGMPYNSAREAVILASVVEKETGLPDERRHIAQVFVNRLKRGMPLQSDPTIIYGLTKGYPLGHGIRQSELASDTPYNTYRIAALPPGPIANPGKDSLLAVLNPDPGNDLYFVADGKGHSIFAPTIGEHARNVMAFRAQERANAAKPLEPDNKMPSPPAIAGQKRPSSGN